MYGWKLHLVVTVAGVWIPLAARLTAANVADNEVAEPMIFGLPDEARFVLGDLHYNAPNVSQACEATNRFLDAVGELKTEPQRHEGTKFSLSFAFVSLCLRGRFANR